ncbi:DNA-binding transcriptional regulator, FrmR family [Erythrobacter litoralis]|nr:DNA-binding transcriptional regulator, FrmR family [Erythrobacter litoralis]
MEDAMKDAATMADAAKAKVQRLNRIAGQVRGVAQMIEDDRYCIDILHQIAAIKSALAKVESLVLKDHAACCVAEAIASGDEAEQRAKFEELVDLLERNRK